MQSKIDSRLQVTNESWVVSLIRKHDHAVIIVESMNHLPSDKGLCIRWFDFLTTERNTHRTQFGSSLSVLFKAIKNPIIQGVVRYCATNKRRPLIDVPEEVTKEDLFSRLGWNEDTNSWLCDAIKVRVMLDDIEKDRQEGRLFQYRGGPVGLNCTTWAWEKLEKAGIDARKKGIGNCFIVRASNNVGTHLRG